MQKLGFPNAKSLDKFKTLCGSMSGNAKAFSSSPRPSMDSTSLGSLGNLKLTAEKLVKEQASIKTDLEISNTKLKKSMDHIHALEEKLQNAFNENATLKVKQKEDEKLWQGLESKFSSTKTLCNQLAETLHQLSGLVQMADKDKELLENKISASSDALDGLNQQMNDLSMKLDSAEETIRIRDKKLEELKNEKEELDEYYKGEKQSTVNLIKDKDNMIKECEETIANNRLTIESLNTKLGEMHCQLKSKEDKISECITTQKKLEKENRDLELCNGGLTKNLDMSLHEIRNIKGSVHAFAALLVEMEKGSSEFLCKFEQMTAMCDTYFKLVLKERDIFSVRSLKQFDELHTKYLYTKSEKDSLQFVNEELKNKVAELKRLQETTVAQLLEEHQLAAQKVQRLESEAESLVSKKIETEELVSRLVEKFHVQSESLRSSDTKVQDLLLRISALETENKDNEEKLQAQVNKKSEEINTLQLKRVKHEEQVRILEERVCHFSNILEEKDQLVLWYKEQEKKLEDQITENQSLLAAAQSKLTEAKKQYNLMVENKQMELSRHLKEISQRNDQAINDIRRKYELEKQEIAQTEKEKADKTVAEIERKFEQKFAECKEESIHNLVRAQEEHAKRVTQIQKEHEKKQLSLTAEHDEELKRVQLQAENELKEKTMLIRSDHKAQMEALRHQYDDECKKMQDELHLQKSREDRQRALLQLQWKVMGDEPKEDQQVNSKKNYPVTSNRKSFGSAKRSQAELGSPYLEVTQTPVSKLLKKVQQNVNSPSVISIPKHKKVTHHEYEVETSNGRTITKRRKTRSTVMFEGPRKPKTQTPKAKTPESFAKGVKGRGNTHPTNIGDLFTEGSLNPYVDDPYAFD